MNPPESPRIARRDFLNALAFSAMAASGIYLDPAQLLDPAEPASHPDQHTAAPAALSDAEIGTLQALIPAIFINTPPAETGHYRTMFTVRGEFSGLHRYHYKLGAFQLQQRAKRTHALPFSAIDAAQARALIQPEVDALTSDGLFRLVSAPSLKFCILDSLAHFIHTDAYIVAGYARWPGVPRGFDEFRQPFGAHRD